MRFAHAIVPGDENSMKPQKCALHMVARAPCTIFFWILASLKQFQTKNLLILLIFCDFQLKNKTKPPFFFPPGAGFSIFFWVNSNAPVPVCLGWNGIGVTLCTGKSHAPHCQQQQAFSFRIAFDKRNKEAPRVQGSGVRRSLWNSPQQWWFCVHHDATGPSRGPCAWIPPRTNGQTSIQNALF